MARCPNCGRETARTEDWSCQWCGYPLLSGFYKKIPKTYRQLQEERLAKQPVEEEVEAEPVEEEVEAEPEPVLEAEPEAELALEAEPEPVLEMEPEAEVVAEAEPEAEPKPKAKRKTVAKAKSIPKSKPATESKPATKRKKAVRTKPVPEAEPEPVMEVEPEPVPEVEVEPELAAAAIEMTVEELLSAYEVEGEAADARFANQILRIKGQVDRIEVKDALDIYYITLTSAEKNLLLRGVRCVFNRQYGPKLEQLTVGQTVTVQGRYTGSMIDISLRECVLVS